MAVFCSRLEHGEIRKNAKVTMLFRRLEHGEIRETAKVTMFLQSLEHGEIRKSTKVTMFWRILKYKSASFTKDTLLVYNTGMKKAEKKYRY